MGVHRRPSSFWSVNVSDAAAPGLRRGSAARAGEPEFVVTPAPVDEPDERALDAQRQLAPPEGDEGATARINLRLPERLKVGVERAASRDRLSVNAWLVRVVAAALARDDPARRPRQRGGRTGEAYTGWVR